MQRPLPFDNDDDDDRVIGDDEPEHGFLDP